ncbi:hypothetical protein [Caballeronia novacaledonica]|nr:hypothetical protein [Caballeronia novacaledonica]
MQAKIESHCPSCGRTDKPRPDGAEPVSIDGERWCSWCAAIRQTPSGAMYIERPSPGRMTDGGLPDDSLDAWLDCYEMKPKKRIRKDDAKAEVQRAWALWDGDKTTGQPMFLFYLWLARQRPYFLTFRAKGDPWQAVHSWLIQYEDRKGCRA